MKRRSTEQHEANSPSAGFRRAGVRFTSKRKNSVVHFGRSTERNLDFLLFAIAFDGQGQLVARFRLPDMLNEVVQLADFFAIELENDVFGLDAGFVRRAIFIYAVDGESLAVFR